MNAEEYFHESEQAFAQDRPDEALEVIERAIELDPVNPEFRTLRARILWEAFKDADNALLDFDFVIENSEPTDPRPYNNRGLFFLQSGQFDLCVKDYTKFVELDPANPWARLERGDCYAALGEDDLARTDYETFLSMVEGNPEFDGSQEHVQSWLDSH